VVPITDQAHLGGSLKFKEIKMDISDITKLVDVGKLKASIVADLVDGDLLDKLYFAAKPSIIKALKESTA
jgi:hypothetical protein